MTQLKPGQCEETQFDLLLKTDRRRRLILADQYGVETHYGQTNRQYNGES